ncbi:hypothetical protein MLD38_005950 [Melastoma candidum]|uniref:Uncharacterized protein n=2 Tax=Melastoma candidum TaxID=119954 RepID=A0ACB9RPD6_9MYRT|nr:hypothetical protein MLD38_005950 [Melastoma candidum]KAI4379686.1 hypothetical protein MLD38_005950 [Melastoma candidum]
MKAAARLKRKDIDSFNDDFADFSLSSPASKIRRLDVELPTIVEVDETDRSLPVMSGRMEAGEELEMDAPSSVNDERAIVLFRPVNDHLLHYRSPSSFSVAVDSELISGFKSQFPWSNRSSGGDFFVDEVADDDRDSSNERCTTVVPWVPSQFPLAPRVEIIDSEVMETEDAGGEGAMEVEEDNPNPSEVVEGVDRNQGGFGGFRAWQQQHCFIPQLSQTVSNPIVWYR